MKSFILALMFGFVGVSVALAGESPDYHAQPPLILNAGSVAFENRYEAPFGEPNVEHLFGITPRAAVDRWSAERLVANGGPNKATIIVEEASVVEVKLNIDDGFTGWFKTEQSERYDASLKVTLRVAEPNGAAMSVASTIRRSITVPEGISLTEREAVWADLTKKLVNDLNAQMEVGLRQHMPQYLM